MSTIEMLERVVASAFYGRFTTLRPVQEAAIEPLVNGRNVVLASGTGSGKTEAVLAPLLSRYWRRAAKTGALTILYIAPTKALVNDLEKRLHPPLDRLGLRVGIRHGDRDDLVSGQTPHILVTTPESLEVLIFRKDAALQTVQAVVVDEVHLLYNTQRGLQLSILLRRLKQGLERDLQWAAYDISLLVNSPVDWKSIPTEPQGYEGIFHLLFEKPSEQSIYQTLLPSQLQLREFLQTWLMDETIAEILSRLCNSKAIQIKSEII
jgi:superfamily II helicase